MVGKKAQMGDFIGFSFNGIHSSELGLVRVSDGNRYEKNLFPAISDKTVQVPGRDGFYYFGSSYNIRELTIKVAFDNLEEKEFRTMVEHFKDKKPHFLWFDELPYKEYLVKIKSPPNFKYLCFDEWVEEENDNGEIMKRKARIYKGEGAIIFVCYSPYARARAKSLSDPVDKVIIKNEGNYLDLVHNHYLDGNNNDNISGEEYRNLFAPQYLELIKNKIEYCDNIEDILIHRFTDFPENDNYIPYFFMEDSSYNDGERKKVFLILMYLWIFFGYDKNYIKYWFFANYLLHCGASIEDLYDNLDSYIELYVSSKTREIFNEVEEDFQNNFKQHDLNAIFSSLLSSTNFFYSLETGVDTGNSNRDIVHQFIFICLYYFLKVKDMLNNQEIIKTKFLYDYYNFIYLKIMEKRHLTSLGLKENLLNNINTIIDGKEVSLIKNEILPLKSFYNFYEWVDSSKMPSKTPEKENNFINIVNCGDIDMNTKILLRDLNNGKCIVNLKDKEGKIINSITIDCVKLQQELDRRGLQGKDKARNPYIYFFLDSQTKLLQAYDICIPATNGSGQLIYIDNILQYTRPNNYSGSWESEKETKNVFNNCIIANDFFKIPADNEKYIIEIDSNSTGTLVDVEYTYLYY